MKEYYVKRSDLEKLLKVNEYDSVEGKISALRDIKLIDTRKSKLTKKVIIEGKLKIFIAFNVYSYNFFKEIRSKL
ncbi:hypothetical protein ACSXAB_16505 (plasmid) [Clostridium perfringens]